MVSLQMNLSYVEQQGLIDALERVYIPLEHNHTGICGTGQEYCPYQRVLREYDYITEERARELIDMLVADLNECVTSKIESGRRYSVDKIEITLE